jgi:hypothetical protein
MGEAMRVYETGGASPPVKPHATNIAVAYGDTNRNGWGVTENEVPTLPAESPRIGVTADPKPGQDVPDDPLPDGPRYAALGDAVTANVAEWIGARLLHALRKESADEAASLSA